MLCGLGGGWQGFSSRPSVKRFWWESAPPESEAMVRKESAEVFGASGQDATRVSPFTSAWEETRRQTQTRLEDDLSLLASGSPRRSWRRERLAARHRDPGPDKRKRTHGWVEVPITLDTFLFMCVIMCNNGKLKKTSECASVGGASRQWAETIKAYLTRLLAQVGVVCSLPRLIGWAAPSE